MKRSPKETIKKIFFPIFIYIYKPVVRIKKYRTETMLSKGRKIKTADAESVLFFTTYKCASVFVGKVLKELTNLRGYRYANFDSYFTHQERDVHKCYRDESFIDAAFRPNGVVYGPMRHYQSVPEIERYKVLLVLRDPRDVLVSHYYSVLFSHSVISKKFLEKRNSNKGKNIDAFVLENLEDYAKIYERYQDQLLGRQNVLFLPYEKMISEPKQFLTRINEFLGLSVEEDAIHKIAEDEMNLPAHEEKYSHKRSGRSGQYLEKLNAVTIEAIENRLDLVLKEFGYR